MYLFVFLNQAQGVPRRTQQETTNATFSPATVELLFTVLHGIPVAPFGTDRTQFQLGLDEKLILKDQERVGIEVASKLDCYLPLNFSVNKKKTTGSAIFSTKMRL